MAYTAIVKNRKLVVLDRQIHIGFDRHVVKWQGCTKCRIGEWAHNKAFIRGNLPCDILFIGEGPGQTEDMTGIPFIGPAGKELDKWIEGSWNSDMPAYEFTWAVTNTVLCRPCDTRVGKNRAPDAMEQFHCLDRAREIFNLAKPKMVFLLGNVAQEWWINNYRELTEKMSDLSYTQSAKFRHPSSVIRMNTDQMLEHREAIIKDMSYSLQWLREREAEKK
jgi:uracil-DNA glycosylase